MKHSRSRNREYAWVLNGYLAEDLEKDLLKRREIYDFSRCQRWFNYESK